LRNEREKKNLKKKKKKKKKKKSWLFSCPVISGSGDGET
jgi:hypothetical protein